MTRQDQIALMNTAVEGAIATFSMFLDQSIEALVERERRKLSRSLDTDEAEAVIERYRACQINRKSAAMALMAEGAHALADNSEA